MLAVLMGTFMITTAWAAAAGAAADQGSTAPQAPHYVDVADEAGLDFTCGAWSKDLGLAPRFFISVFFCPSPVIADFNGDGYQDVLFPNQRYTDAAVNEDRDPQDQLYLNNGDGTFRDVTRLAIPHDAGNSMAAAPIDLEGDGDLDLYVANYPMDKFGVQSPATTFYINNGDGTFTSQVPPGLTTRPVDGIPDSQFGSAVAVADYDKDGDLDIYRGHYAVHPFPSGMPASLQLTTPETNLLYENQGDGTFQDVTFRTSASILPGRTFAVNFADFNGDTWPDIYVANDENPNELYLNVPGDAPGERAFEFAAGNGAEDDRGAMCSEPADFDNDGDLDLYMSHYESEENGYYLGNGDGTFEGAVGLGDLERGYHLLGWACPGFDMENDGDRDLYVANGHMVPSGGEFFEEGPPGAGPDDNGYALPNLLFRNTLVETGQHSWADMSGLAGPGIGAREVSSGAQAFDVELDGTQEILVVNNNNDEPNLLKNTAETGHWLSLELRGAGTNTHAIGAQVQVEAGALTLHDQMITGDTLASGSAMPLHFGLGEETGPATVTVTWPDGTTQSETVAIDQHVRIVQDQGVALDTLAPQVQLATDAQSNEAGWYTQDPLTVDLTVQDRGQGETSGVSEVRYRVDDGPIVPYTGSFQLSGDGAHTVTVFTSDQAGNEAWFPYELKIDATAPEGEVTSPEEGTVVVQERSVVEAPGGQTTMLSAVHTPQGPAQHADLALEGVAHEAERNTGVDPGPIPASVHEAQMGTAGSDGRTSVQVDAQDATSGVDRVEFLLDGELQAVDRSEPYGWDADLRGQALGEHTLTARVVDAAGLETTDELVFEVVPNTPDGAMNTAEAGPGELAAQGTSTSKQAPATTDPGLEEHRKQAILSALGPRSQVTGYETDAPPQYMNGVSSYIMANTRDAPIWRQFSFIPNSKTDGSTLGQYTVLNMETFLATDGVGLIYQFPECQTLSPVLSDPVRKPLPSGGEDREHDQPIRQIVDVVLETDCAYQPTSQDQVEEMAVSRVARELYVNAPKVPDQLMDWSDERFFNAPPFRPRIPAYQEGDVAQFLTYEASWVAPWTGIQMPGTQDVFILSPTPTFRPDFTIFNVNVGAPMHEDFEKYSPLWVGNCIVDKDNKKCMISVNKRAGYEQCRTVTECMNMDRDGDEVPDVESVAPNTWTHVNCPFVAIDTNNNDIIEPWEELYFPDLWVDGPVIV